MQERAKRLGRTAREIEGTLFNIAHEGSARIIAEHERRLDHMAVTIETSQLHNWQQIPIVELRG